MCFIFHKKIFKSKFSFLLCSVCVYNIDVQCKQKTEENMNKIVIKDYIKELALEAEDNLKEQFKAADDVCLFNSEKVLNAFLKHELSYSDFAEINGYAFFDDSRDKLEAIFADALGSEAALVRPQIMSGTNAIWITLSALLKSGDTMLCVCGAPYDPLQEIMGSRGNSPLSLKASGVNYEEIELIDNDFDYETIEKRLKKGGVKLVEIQRSCGYSIRRGITLSQIEKLSKLVKSIDSGIIIMCDNCYGEMVERREPPEAGVDIIAGSLMHNLGGGIASSGGYIAGRLDLVELCSQRLTAPGIGKYLGADYNQKNKFLKGLYMAPQTVKNAVKSAMLAAYIAEKAGFTGVSPGSREYRSDTVQCFNLGSKERLIKFCEALQAVSPVDSIYTPVPCEMPGYPHDEIMSAGCFSQGSTIELTCDAPVTEPFRVFLQGGLAYEHSKLCLMAAFSRIL